MCFCILFVNIEITNPMGDDLYSSLSIMYNLTSLPIFQLPLSPSSSPVLPLFIQSHFFSDACGLIFPKLILIEDKCCLQVKYQCFDTCVRACVRSMVFSLPFLMVWNANSIASREVQLLKFYWNIVGR